LKEKGVKEFENDIANHSTDYTSDEEFKWKDKGKY